MDLRTVHSVLDPRSAGPWQAGDAYLAGGTWLFSEPQVHLRRLVDITRWGWEPVVCLADGDLEIAATCTVEQLVRAAASMPDIATAAAAPLVSQCADAFLASFKVQHVATVGGNLCNGLPAGPMISLTAALDGVCRILDTEGHERSVAVEEFVVGAGITTLAPGDLLRSITVPASSLARRTTLRRASLSQLGRSGVLVIGTWGDDAGLTVNVTASTPRPVRVTFGALPTAAELTAAIEEAVAPIGWYDDVHGRPEWRRHMTLLFAEQIRRERDAA